MPPNPDPELYILVKTKEGAFWRRKRGTVTKATVNKTLSSNNDAYKVLMPAASAILRRLAPYTRSLTMGRVTIKIAGKLLKPFLETKKIKLGMLKGFDFQPEFPLDRILEADYAINTEGKRIIIRIDLEKGTVKPQNNLVTDYYFESILLYGYPDKEKGLKINSAESILYAFSSKKRGICELELAAAPTISPWLLLLKINCLEGNEPASHSKNYALQIIAANS
jgi:hypothetical protein